MIFHQFVILIIENFDTIKWKEQRKKVYEEIEICFLALLFFLARPEGALASDGTWQGKQYLKADGSPAANEWILMLTINLGFI